MKMFALSTLLKKCTQVGYVLKTTYIEQINLFKLRKLLSQNFKAKMPSSYSINDDEFLSKDLELVFEELNAIVSYLNLNIKKIHSDFEASSILAELIAFEDFTSKTATDTICVDSFLYRNINEIYFPIRNVSQKYSALIGLTILTQKKNCICWEEHIFKRMLCDDCFKLYNIDFCKYFENDKTALSFLESPEFNKYFCNTCKEKIKNYYAEKSKKQFCSICLENRIIRAYNNLREYIAELNFYNIFKKKDYIDFLEKAISIIYYKKELLPYGNGYFPTNHT